MATASTTTSAAAGTPSGVPAAQVSENPLDYLSMIVYVRRGHPTCEQLVALVSSRMDVLVQDVDNLQGDVPPWLRGVPTIVQLPGREVMTGTKAMDTVEALCERDLMGVDTHVGFASGGAPIGGAAAATSPGFASLFVCQEDEENPVLARTAPLPTTSGRDGRYEDVSREKKNDLTLEDALRMREGPRTRQLPA